MTVEPPSKPVLAAIVALIWLTVIFLVGLSLSTWITHLLHGPTWVSALLWGGFFGYWLFRIWFGADWWLGKQVFLRVTQWRHDLVMGWLVWALKRHGKKDPQKPFLLIRKWELEDNADIRMCQMLRQRLTIEQLVNGQI